VAEEVGGAGSALSEDDEPSEEDEPQPKRCKKKGKEPRVTYGYEWDRSTSFPLASFVPRERALYKSLLAWASEEAEKRPGTPAYYVMQKKTAAAIVVAERAGSLHMKSDLRYCWGMGPVKVRDHGNHLLWMVKESRPK
jgi:hypothetical protein